MGPTSATTFCIRAAVASLTSGLAAAALLLVGQGVASASCAAGVSLQDAIQQTDAVVVGTVTGTRSLGRIATVHVEQRWKGDLPASFELFGGPQSERSATSVDRTYEAGQRYLFFVFEPSTHGSSGTFGGRYEDNGCSATQKYVSALAALRPAGATTATTTGRSGPASANFARTSSPERRWGWFGLAGGLVALLLGFLVARRGHRARVGADAEGRRSRPSIG